MSVGSNGIGPATNTVWCGVLSVGLRPDGLVVIEEVGEMVLDQIFPGHSQVYRIPVGKLSSQTPVISDNYTTTMEPLNRGHLCLYTKTMEPLHRGHLCLYIQSFSTTKSHMVILNLGGLDESIGTARSSVLCREAISITEGPLSEVYQRFLGLICRV